MGSKSKQNAGKEESHFKKIHFVVESKFWLPFCSLILAVPRGKRTKRRMGRIVANHMVFGEANDSRGLVRVENAASFSSARATKRLPSPRCTSAIQIVRPPESTAATQPQLQPDSA